MRSSILTIFFTLLISSQAVFSQDLAEFLEYEDSLKSLSVKVMSAPTEAERYEANEIMLETFADALSLNNSFKYPFDSLEYLMKVISEDQQVRIFTWAIGKDDGTFEYFGFLQSYSKKKKGYVFWELDDHSDDIQNPEHKVLDNKLWYGALYYDIIVTKSGKQTFYTLLGWDGNDKLTNKKIIEVLTIRSNGMPKFGYSLFRWDRKRMKRIFFEYNEQASMVLSYDEQFYYVKKKRLIKKKSSKPGLFRRLFSGNSSNDAQPPAVLQSKSGRYKYVRKKGFLIIFDRLEAMDPSLEDHYEYYVPETNIVDALVFRNGKWYYYPDIDARNLNEDEEEYDNSTPRDDGLFEDEEKEEEEDPGNEEGELPDDIDDL